MVLPVVGQRLVERTVLLLGDIAGVASPDGLGLVELLVDNLLLLDLLGLLLVLILVLIDLFDLGLFAVFVILDLLVILNFL
jgi:hypothetical protein